MNFYYYFLIKNQATKTGHYFLYIRASKGGNTKFLSTNIKVLEKHWDHRKQRILFKDKQYVYKNNLLDAMKSRAETIILEALVNKENLTLYKFIDLLKNGAVQTMNFYEFAEKVANDKKHKISTVTFKNYGYQVDKIKTFSGSFTIADIDLDFINKYDKHLLTHFGNNENTRIKSLTYLRMICNEAVKNDLINKSPFLSFKIGTMSSRDEFLSLNNLATLEELYKNNTFKGSLHITLRCFLFACYTGVSYSDLKALKFRNIINVKVDDETYKLIDFKRQKTKNQFRIPLITKAELLLDKRFSDSQPIMKTFANKTLNEKLKVIQGKAKININMTFHLARHTFGTHFTSFGIPENFIMEMMGHKDKNVSRMYSKIQNEDLVKMMNKVTKKSNQDPA